MRAALGLGLVVALASPVFAQPDRGLRDSESARNAALDAGDAKAYAAYITADYLTVGADGRVKTRPQLLAEIDGHPRTEKPVPSEEQWRVYSSTAIDTRRLDTVGRQPVRQTIVWIKMDGFWKVASIHETAIGG